MSSSILPRAGSVLLSVTLLAGAGCSKDALSPDKQVVFIELAPHSALLYAVGQQQQFTAGLTTAANTNGEGIEVSFVARDTTLLQVSASGVATARRKGGSTYVVATAGGLSDSALVEVPATTCGSTAATTMTVGQVVTDIGEAGFCSKASDGEFAVIIHNSSFAGAGSAAIEVTPIGVGAPPASAAFSVAVPPAQLSGVERHWRRDAAAEMRFRRQEAETAAPFAATAREWYANRSRRAARATAALTVGDLMRTNVNISGNGCTDSTMVDLRVAAISNNAIVLEDPRNPAGGYTDQEYAAFAQSFDQVINPLDTTQFGSPTDLDGNGRVLLVFTRAVNERTPPKADYYVGGLTFSRDLLPKSGTGTNGVDFCKGSNVAEMFYLLVPDPDSVVNTNPFTKAFVTSVTEATIAHEYQHLINFARRRYLNPNSPQPGAELWLNEGLSHMAEELLYYAKSGRSPRTNITGASLSTADATYNDWVFYASGDFLNYDEYVFAPAETSPFESGDDLATRGATWSFLRYLADQLLTGGDGRVWYNLVNSGESGITNLKNRFGLTDATLKAALRDFVISNYTDDFVSGVAAKYTQPSWNMRSIYPRLNQILSPKQPFLWPLNGTSLNDKQTRSASIQAGAFKVYRFTGMTGADSYIRLKGTGGTSLPAGVTLSVVRTQ